MRRPSRVLTALAAVVMVAGAGVLAAPAASAAPSPSDVIIQPINPGACSASNTRVVDFFSSTLVTSITGTDGVLTVLNACQNTVYVYVPGVVGSGDLASSGTGTWSLSSATTTFEIYQATGGSTAWVSIPISVSSGGGGGGGSSEVSSSESVSVPAALTLDVNASTGGASCKEGSSVTGYTGEWLTLPGSGDCTLPSKPGAVLLGWSTSADFPVAIAQRQATNKWGTYELTDAAGVVTATFIPAGWQTFVSGPNTLHPIWSN